MARGLFGVEMETRRGIAPRNPHVRTVLWRGMRRRCPHCGQGPLFSRWITFHPRCASCGLVFLRNQGDTWAFWIIMDRIPLFAGIVAIYFGFRITGWLSGLLFFLAIAGPLVLTMPQRQGVALAMSYLGRGLVPGPVRRDPASGRPGMTARCDPQSRTNRSHVRRFPA